MRIAGVFVVLEQLCRDGERDRRRQPLGRAGQLTAHHDARIGLCQPHEGGGELVGNVPVVAQQPDRPGADIFGRMAQHLCGERLVQSAAEMDCPQRLKRARLVRRGGEFLLKFRHDRTILPLAEDPPGLSPIPLVRMVQKRGDVVRGQLIQTGFRLLERFAPFRRHAKDSSVVAAGGVPLAAILRVRVTQIDVVPVGDVKRAVRPDRRVDRPKPNVARQDEISAIPRRERRASLFKVVPAERISAACSGQCSCC